MRLGDVHTGLREVFTRSQGTDLLLCLVLDQSFENRERMVTAVPSPSLERFFRWMLRSCSSRKCSMHYGPLNRHC